MKPVIIVSFIGLIGLLPASALAAGEHDAHAGHMASKAPAESPLSEGIVKKVDKASGKITITHGPLLNLDMPAMTMVFRVSEAAWLDQLQAGRTIRFLADSVNGSLTIVRLEVAK